MRSFAEYVAPWWYQHRQAKKETQLRIKESVSTANRVRRRLNELSLELQRRTH